MPFAKGKKIGPSEKLSEKERREKRGEKRGNKEEKKKFCLIHIETLFPPFFKNKQIIIPK